MKIKKKLFLGFGLLFVVVLFFGAVSIYYIEEISETAKVTLKNNYQTLMFTREMRSVLDENNLPLTSKAADTFDKSLKKQENNITEPGEKEATAGVRKGFELIIDPKLNISQKEAAIEDVRSLLKTIDGLNLTAIVSEENSTHTTVNKTTIFLGSMALITFLILFVLIAGFPGFIINPLNEFAEGLQDISQKNYGVRLDFTTSEEFTKLSGAFNTMATSLADHEITSLTKILSEEARIKVLIEEIPDVVIGVNGDHEVLFMNAAAKTLLNLEHIQVIGKSIVSLITDSPLLKIILDNAELDAPLMVEQDGETAAYHQKNIEIVVPNLKVNPTYAVQYSGFTDGIIYILKKVD
ncbi:MAG: PAS domain-containing protein [Sphingobacteriales bacterium]